MRCDESQITFFDIVLPGADEEIQLIDEQPKDDSPIIIQPNTDFSPARVPDEEFRKPIYGRMKLPTVDSILKKINQDSYTVSIYDFLSDTFECGAIAISNRFWPSKAREEQYLKIMNKYDEKTRRRIQDVFADIYILLTSQIDGGFGDYLGELYMKSSTSNSRSGQFFTPYCVSKMCAELSICQADIDGYIPRDKIVTMNEPACGAGGMVIAAVDVLYNKYHFNYARNLLVECSDIDKRCVHMSYLQLSCAGIPAIIYHRNTITMETWDRWETPAYIMQYHRFRNVLEVTKND